jgi:hypothetical protein
MYEAQDVLEAARAIRPHLSELVPLDAGDVDNRLGRLIQRAEGGQDVKLEILELLSEREATRDWADRLLAVPEEYRSYKPLAGRVQRVSVPRYVCPQGDYTWYRFSKGDVIPVCPRHGVALVYRTS